MLLVLIDKSESKSQSKVQAPKPLRVKSKRGKGNLD